MAEVVPRAGYQGLLLGCDGSISRRPKASSSYRKPALTGRKVFPNPRAASICHRGERKSGVYSAGCAFIGDLVQPPGGAGHGCHELLLIDQMHFLRSHDRANLNKLPVAEEAEVRASVTYTFR
jgi:hypothetical protein